MDALYRWIQVAMDALYWWIRVAMLLNGAIDSLLWYLGKNTDSTVAAGTVGTAGTAETVRNQPARLI